MPVHLVGVDMQKCYGIQAADISDDAHLCENAENIYVDGDGHALGGYGRGAIYGNIDVLSQKLT